MKRFFFAALIALTTAACVPGDEPDLTTENNTPDRAALLTHWADNLILPAYRSYGQTLESMLSATERFSQAPDEASLAELRTTWREAYRAWQWVSMYEIGPAEAATLRNFTNIYPTDPEAIEENVAAKNYTFNLPSKYDEQGFPALDYLLYGLASTDDELLSRYTDAEWGDAYRGYLQAVVNRLNELTAPVIAEWEGAYRDSFVGNTSISATGALNTLVNDYLFFYEKALRAGKVGIPAGVFSGAPLPHTVEGRYAGDISRALLLESIDAVQYFFNGRAIGSESSALGLAAYLDQVEVDREAEPLSAQINAQFDKARAAAQQLQPNLAQQITDDNPAMLATYDALQKNVVLMKVDMFQALNVQVDFVDADGD
ncbi:MAG: imelysin family protein [Tunicatimonas sp.]